MILTGGAKTNNLFRGTTWIMNKIIGRKFNSLILIALLLLSCEENCDQPSCLPGPEGTIQSGSKNLTIFTQVNDIQHMILVGNNEYTLSLDGLNPKQGMFFSTWQTIPDNEYTMVKIIIDGEPLEISLGNYPSAEQLQLSITEENRMLTIESSKFEKCDDTPCD
ncbi:MAG: hypothetical protein WBG48_14835 [Pricia sp.]